MFLKPKLTTTYLNLGSLPQSYLVIYPQKIIFEHDFHTKACKK